MTLENQPEFRVFEFSADATLADFLYIGMDLERGAWRFYSAVLQRHNEAAFAGPIDLLARAEEGHARLLYKFWAEDQDDPPSFEEVYGSMKGEIIEGGQDVESMVKRLAEASEDPCLEIVEMSLGIEFAAYDLYRAMAHKYRGTRVEEPFVAIAQAEKEHMRIASDALQFCSTS